MVGWWLRWIVALALLAAFAVLRAGGVCLAYAVLLSIIILFAAHAALILGTFAVSWPRPAEAPSERNPAPAPPGTIAFECLAFFVLFTVIQPFETLFMGIRDRKAQSGNKPQVLLVHGYVCNRGLWWWLSMRLRSHGITGKALNLEPPLASMNVLAERLHVHIEACLQDRPGEKLVLITHSMGGLAARAYLNRHGSARVAQLITLACPHHGTRLAYLGLGRNAREMEPGSAWLSALSVCEPLPLPIVNVWSIHDNFISPQKNGELLGAREIVLPRLGHLSFLFSGRILEILIRELDRLA